MEDYEPFYAGKEVQEPYFFNRVNEIKELKRKLASPTAVNTSSVFPAAVR